MSEEAMQRAGDWRLRLFAAQIEHAQRRQLWRMATLRRAAQ